MVILAENRIAALLFILFLLFPGGKLFSQNSKNIIQGEFKAGDAIVSPTLTAPCMGLRNQPSEDLDWQPLIIPKNFEPENPSPNEELLGKIKSEKQKLKDQAELMRHDQPEREISPETYTPVVVKDTLGNLYNGGSPLDNCIAVSDGGIVVSTANTTFRIYDANGMPIYSKSVLSVINDPSISNVCDEYVLYDRGADRFIAFSEECSGDYTKTALLILFSKTNNPATGGWWYYKLPGNPFAGKYDWFDYPKIAVSNGELFISGNMFNGKDFDEAAVWQIKKSDGYAGSASLSYKIWHQLADNPFTVCPVGEGQGGSYGPGCYMISNNSNGGSDIKLYQITNDIGGSPQLIYHNIGTTAYSPAADASQMGTAVKLKINDCRMMNGFFLNNIIHFVFNTDYKGEGYNAGYSGIYYGRLNLNNNTIISKIFSTNYYDYGYPAVASFATSLTDKSVMIGYGLAGSSIYPQIGVINCDDGMFWSDPVVIKASAAYVTDGSTPGTSRWGDYTGMARLHSSDTPSVWMSGSYGNSGNHWTGWIARISGTDQVIHAPPPLTDTKVYPNPLILSNLFYLEFSLPEASEVVVDIFNAQGKLVKHLYDGPAFEGNNELSFNSATLAKGVYILTIQSNSSTLVNKKISIAN